MLLYDRAKAKLMAWVGQFMALRDRILRMRDEAAYLEKKGERSGDERLRQAALGLRREVDLVYDAQRRLEGQLQSVLSESQGSAQPTLSQLAVMTGTALKLAGRIAAHREKVNQLDRLLAQVKGKTLTTSEAAALQRGAGGPGFGGAGLAIAVVAGFGLWFLLRGRRS